VLHKYNVNSIKCRTQ